MSDTDNEGTEFTVPQLTAIVAKLKKKLARFEYRLEGTILREKIVSARAGAEYQKKIESGEIDVYDSKYDPTNRSTKYDKKNMPGTTIPIALAKKIASYTIDQLQDFNSHIIDGIEYGINIRGDVVDTDGTFIGYYDEKAKKLLKGVVQPADWSRVMSLY